MRDWRRFVLVMGGLLGVSILAQLLAYQFRNGVAHAQNVSYGIPWSCSVDAVGTAVKECLPVLGSLNLSSQDQMRLYVTDIVATSTTATGGEMVLQYGTGADCVTTAVNFFPASGTAGVVRYGYSGNTVAPVPISFQTPLVIPATKRVCVIGIATQTLTIQINGRLAP